MLIIGVDPGLSGALALYGPKSGRLEVVDVPTFAIRGKTAKRDLNGAEVARIIDAWAQQGVTAAVVERIGAMPGQGIASTAIFMETAGRLMGVIEAHFIPLLRPAPAVWKKHFRLGASKDASRAKATAMFPRHSALFARVKDDGRAEAALLAVYGHDALDLEALDHA